MENITTWKSLLLFGIGASQTNKCVHCGMKIHLYVRDLWRDRVVSGLVIIRGKVPYKTKLWLTIDLDMNGT